MAFFLSKQPPSDDSPMSGEKRKLNYFSGASDNPMSAVVKKLTVNNKQLTKK
jgi:hypothetical protein